MSKKLRSSSPQSRYPIPASRHEGTNAIGTAVHMLSPGRNKHHDQPESKLADLQPLPETPKNMSRFSTIHSPLPSANTSITNGNLLTPVQNGVRRSSGGFTASSPSNGDTTPQMNGQSQNAPTSPLSANANGEQWSSAVGHATTTGKSGRVIEKLMAENDRLKREFKEQQTKADELQQRVQMVQPRIQALEAENGNLSHARDVDQALLARRDRQNADLKEELENERQRRKALETRARDLQSERDEAIETKAREIQIMTETTKQATIHADILQQSFRQQKQSEEARVHGTRKEIDQLQLEKKEDRDKLIKMDVVQEQLRQEIERQAKINAEMAKLWQEMKEAYKTNAAALHKESTAETEKARKLSAQMDQVLGEMKYVINLKKNTDLDGSKDQAR